MIAIIENDLIFERNFSPQRSLVFQTRFDPLKVFAIIAY